jgi:hypothetical protein
MPYVPKGITGYDDDDDEYVQSKPNSNLQYLNFRNRATERPFKIIKIEWKIYH